MKSRLLTSPAHSTSPPSTTMFWPSPGEMASASMRPRMSLPPNSGMVFASSTTMAVLRFAQDWHLLVIGTVAFGAGSLGYLARRRGRPRAARHPRAGAGPGRQRRPGPRFALNQSGKPNFPFVQ